MNVSLLSLSYVDHRSRAGFGKDIRIEKFLLEIRIENEIKLFIQNGENCIKKMSLSLSTYFYIMSEKVDKMHKLERHIRAQLRRRSSMLVNFFHI